jgi:hypothetical protein
MAFTKITQLGENFITQICTQGMIPKNGNTLLSGQQRTSLPFTSGKTGSYPSENHVWEAIFNYNGTKVTTATQLATALISWFNKYAEIYDLDANVIAAQAYIESKYTMRAYVDYAPRLGNLQSTASGVSQFLLAAIYTVIIKNGYHKTGTPSFSQDEINKITQGTLNPTLENSYNVGSSAITPSPTVQTTWHNRPILFQNVINNPEIMIKAQCVYMRHIADLGNDFTSSALFGYNRGPGYIKSTYTDTIQECLGKTSNTYIQEGLNYVLQIFGVLGDFDNFLVSKGLPRGYKPAKYYFGYDEKTFPDIGKVPNPKNLRLKQTFDISTANIKQSEKYSTPPVSTTTTT